MIKVKITLSIRGKKKTVNGKTLPEILEKEGINPEEYVLVKGNEIVLEDEKLKDGNEIKLLPVVSGG